MEAKKARLSDKRGRLVVISGVSAGAGKDTIIKIFLERHPDWQNPPSTVTRPPRPGEKEGVDYFFVDEAVFKKKAETGDFLETDFHADHWYGTLKKPIEEALAAGRNVIVRKDVNGATAIKKMMPEAVVIFIDVEGPEVLESRIRLRQTETEGQIRRRLKLAKREQEFKKHFDYVVVNLHNRVQEAIEAVERIAGV
jgi:guanylate kinase